MIQHGTFYINTLSSGRQVKGTPIEGFPNGLPDLTPLGVRITLENMIGNRFVQTWLDIQSLQVLMARWWWIPFLERQEQTIQCSQKVGGLNSKNCKSLLFCFFSARDRVQLCSAAISARHLHRHSSRLSGDFHILFSFSGETISLLFAAFLHVRGERTVNCLPLSERDNLQPTVLCLWLVNIERLTPTFWST